MYGEDIGSFLQIDLEVGYKNYYYSLPETRIILLQRRAIKRAVSIMFLFLQSDGHFRAEPFFSAEQRKIIFIPDQSRHLSRAGAAIIIRFKIHCTSCI